METQIAAEKAEIVTEKETIAAEKTQRLAEKGKTRLTNTRAFDIMGAEKTKGRSYEKRRRQ